MIKANMIIDKQTILKYDKPGPRYTSYPTAPEWSEAVNASTYIDKLNQFGQTDKTLSLYVHLPFCESMCTYCACNVVIRKTDEKYADEYLDYLFKEIDLVIKHLGNKRIVKQLHWGGGTPNFLSESQSELLIEKLRDAFDVDPVGEIAVEIDPRTISYSKLVKLRELGFNRISLGVQDFDSSVQETMNRVQPFSLVRDVSGWSRKLGFQSINFDLIYGLPGQSSTSFKDTVSKVIQLNPDRIALYSFAYVPWLKKHQNKIAPESLPDNETKLDLFLLAREEFLGNGYQAIAMDHFALKTDELAKAYNQNCLYRNFMGYTVKPADDFLGLGVTSIGFLENTFIQNFKALPEYYRLLKEDTLPVERGKELSKDDLIRQWVIHSFMCHFQLNKNSFKKQFHLNFNDYFNLELDHINQCLKEGLLKQTADKILVTEFGRLFIRNICMGFDFYLRQKGSHQKFSRTV